MSYSTFSFIKDFQERSDEFNIILNKSLKSTDIKEHWKNYIELTIEPVGWQAVWKMSKDICSDLKIQFPCTVIVIVEQVYFKDLSCLVSVSAVDDENIVLPEIISDVPLVELYPTMEQHPSSALNLNDTARSIDCLRFFYKHLWMPWDLEVEEDLSWVESHLQGRLLLHFSMLERKIPHELAHKVRSVMVEGHRVQQQIEDLQEALEGDIHVDVSADRLLQLTELHNQLCQLRYKFTIYEKPDLMKALIERDLVPPVQRCPVKMVVLNTTLPEQLATLARIAHDSTAPDTQLRMVPSLQEALVKAPAGGCVWVTQGNHPIYTLGCLETGGSIQGVEAGVVVTDDPASSTNLDLLYDCLSLARLTLHVTSSWGVIKMRTGTSCIMTEVRLEGSSVTDGVNVYSGSRLVATNCTFTNCRTAIIAYTGSDVKLEGCTFTGNNIAVQLEEACSFSMQDCVISGSKLYGVQAVLSNLPAVEDTSVIQLNCFPKFSESGTVWENNTKDVYLHQRTWHAKPKDNELMNGC